MPPKRKSTGSSAPANKKAKAAASAPAATEAPFEPPRGERWAAVSASANIEGSYRMVWKNEERAYSYVTLCQPPYIRDADDEDEDSEGSDGEGSDGDEDKEEEEDNEYDDDDDDDDKTKRLGPRCGKKRCVCFKPLSENPEHPWVISWAGYRKLNSQFTLTNLRDPDNFSMYTFNDHAGYGSLEVLQNLFLDFEEAAEEKRGEWREQWAICECVVHWLLHWAGMRFREIDDGDRVWESTKLVGRMFLSMLAQLDDLGLVGDATAVKSLGCTMAMYMVLLSEIENIPLDDEEDESPEDAILSYANKRGVTLRGPDDIEEVIAQADGNVELPAQNAKDPWGWKAALAQYKKSGGGTIGGDDYDITTWASAKRKEASFDKKDPLSKKDLDAIKKGMVMQMGG